MLRSRGANGEINGRLNAEAFIDISDQVNAASDRGLLDIAIHPDFTNNPYVYLLYTYDPPEAANFTTAVPGSEVILLGKNSTWDNYNGLANSTIDFDEPRCRRPTRRHLSKRHLSRR